MGYVCSSDDGRPPVVVIMPLGDGIDTDAWCAECYQQFISLQAQALGMSVSGDLSGAIAAVREAIAERVTDVDMFGKSQAQKDFAISQLKKLDDEVSKRLESDDPPKTYEQGYEDAKDEAWEAEIEAAELA